MAKTSFFSSDSPTAVDPNDFQTLVKAVNDEFAVAQANNDASVANAQAATNLANDAVALLNTSKNYVVSVASDVDTAKTQAQAASTAATASQAAAAASATAAATSASQATSNGAAQVQLATTQAQASAASATAAQTAQTAAQNARDTAIGQAQAALNSANAASTSATNAATSATNAANSATAVANALSTKAPLASPAFTGTVTGVTAAMVGLGNVNNTSDANKPISSATQTALNAKAPLASPSFSGSVTAPLVLAPVIAYDAETFPTSGTTAYHYGLKWGITDYSSNWGPAALLSGFGGISLYTAGTDRVHVDYAGNIGIGVIPSQWHSVAKAMDIGGYGSLVASAVPGSTSSVELYGNAYFSTNAVYGYKAAGNASLYQQSAGVHRWMVAGNGSSAGQVISWTTAMILDNSGNLSLIGDAAFGKASMVRITAAGQYSNITVNGDVLYKGNDDVTPVVVAMHNGSSIRVNKTTLQFRANNAATDQMILDSTGNLLVGTTGSGGGHAIVKNNGQGSKIIDIVGYGAGGVTVYRADGTGFSSQTTGMSVAGNTTTGRSINAAGTINAGGADYAEYMAKAENCGDLPKGAIVGITADGELTDKWVNAVSFLIKSTNPSYVGGDTWGTEGAIGLIRPMEPMFSAPAYTGSDDPGESPVAPDALPDDASDDDKEAYAKVQDAYTAAKADYDAKAAAFAADKAVYAAAVQAAQDTFNAVTMPAYQAELKTFEDTLETARQKVDRIAYCGQVPVNVKGAKPGDYIIPMQDGAGIKGVPMDIGILTFALYAKAVGVVQNILPDGRANVRVKVV